MDTQKIPHAALEAAVLYLGGQSAMARLCAVSQPTVWKWLHGKSRLPAEFVIRIEDATGVSRHDLRPDIYPPEDYTASIAPIDPDAGPSARIVSFHAPLRPGSPYLGRKTAPDNTPRLSEPPPDSTPKKGPRGHD